MHAHQQPAATDNSQDRDAAIQIATQNQTQEQKMNATKITTVRMNCRNHLQIDLADCNADKAAELKAAGGKFHGDGRYLFDLTYMSAAQIERIKAIATR